MRILLVDDDKASRRAILWFLKSQQHEVTECSNAKEALARIGEQNYPMVLSDIHMPGMSGLELAAAIKELPNSWQTDVVLFTGHGNLKSAIAALRAGVYDYLERPVEVEELASVIERVSEHQALLRENKLLTEKFEEAVSTAAEEERCELSKMKQVVAQAFIGSVALYSVKMRSIWEQAQKLHADRNIPVLIQGETGTGKEIIAKAIHYGDSFDKARIGSFVDINCAALAENLFESELFGYEAGSFTGGASKGQKGKFDLAQGGTLFLDEVGEIPLNLQGKLLRVLQEKEFYRVGGLKKIRIDARIICATNRSLEECVEQGSFRRDLYYRLKVGHIVIPPLRERREEILPMANLFLQEFSRQKHKQFETINPETARFLKQNDWPGNIRELKNTIDYATFAFDGRELLPEHLCGLSNLHPAEKSDISIPDNMLALPFPPQGYTMKKYNDDIINKVLAAFEGNQTATAAYLGISRRAIVYHLEALRGKPD